jgi:hypothetical protein
VVLRGMLMLGLLREICFVCSVPPLLPSFLPSPLSLSSPTTSLLTSPPLTAKSKKQRRVAAKALRKQQLSNPEALAPKIPLHEQTIDLPAGDGSLEGAIEAMEARDALIKSMRKNRRAKIKEANFLKAMG